MRKDFLDLGDHRPAAVSMAQTTLALPPPRRRTGLRWVLAASLAIGWALGWFQEHVAGIPGALLP